MKMTSLLFIGLFLYSLTGTAHASAEEASSARGSGLEIAQILQQRISSTITGSKDAILLPTAIRKDTNLFVGTSLTVFNPHVRNIKEIEITGGISSNSKKPGGIVEITARW